jgi:hypothetical protein
VRVHHVRVEPVDDGGQATAEAGMRPRRVERPARLPVQRGRPDPGRYHVHGHAAIVHRGWPRSAGDHDHVVPGAVQFLAEAAHVRLQPAGRRRVEVGHQQDPHRHTRA